MRLEESEKEAALPTIPGTESRSVRADRVAKSVAQILALGDVTPG